VSYDKAEEWKPKLVFRGPEEEDLEDEENDVRPTKYV
jgi:hypothetical protein